MTNQERLQTRLDAVCQQIAELSAANYDLPNVSGAPDHIDFVGKIRALYEERAMLREAIAEEEGGFFAPYELDLE